MSHTHAQFFPIEDIKKNRDQYFLVFISLLLAVVAYFFQNYFKYYEEFGYDLVRSFLFNLIAIGSFILFIPFIPRLHYFIRSKTERFEMFLLHGISLVSILILYAMLISVFLYVIGFNTELIANRFLTKYFLNMALLHGLYYFFVVLFLTPTKKAPDFLSVSHLNKTVQCKLSSVIWMEAMDHYVKIHTDEKVYLKKISMSALIKSLDSDQFIRIHRSYIVNRGFIKTIEKEKEASFIILDNDTSLKVGKTYIKSTSLLFHH